MLTCLVACASAAAFADTIITIKPELSLAADGKAVISNARAYCPDATSIFLDTTTVPGRSLYAFLLAASAAEREIHIQTGCTCNNNCSSFGNVPVYKACAALVNNFCP